MGCDRLFKVLENWFGDLIVKRGKKSLTIAFPLDKLVRSSVKDFIKNLELYLVLDDGRHFGVVYYEGDNSMSFDLSLQRGEDVVQESFLCVGGVRVSLGRVKGVSSVLVEVGE